MIVKIINVSNSRGEATLKIVKRLLVAEDGRFILYDNEITTSKVSKLLTVRSFNIYSSQNSLIFHM